MRSIKAILNPPTAKMVGDGFKMHNFFPNGYRLKMSPFFMLDYNAKMDLPPSDAPQGVGVHPHRGFETVTIAYHGAISHHDSAGNSGTIYPGDIQWMTAASGILHKEYHEEEFSKTGGPFQMVQLWINVPAKFKMTEPKYQGLKGSELAYFELQGDAGRVEVIAGSYSGISGLATTFTPIEMYNVRLNPDGEVNFDFPANFNTAFLMISGRITVNGTEQAELNQLVHFSNDGTEVTVKALEESVF
jgi:redox-sensitive bicupin YhaK (pirin superfamily)